MYGEDVQSLERHRVVAAPQVLVAQQVGEIRRQRAPDAFVFRLGNQPTAQLQAKELSRGEHLPVAGVAPSMQAVDLVARRDGLVGHEARRYPRPAVGRIGRSGQILGVRPFEESTLVLRLAARIVILQGEQAERERISGQAFTCPQCGQRKPPAIWFRSMRDGASCRSGGRVRIGVEQDPHFHMSSSMWEKSPRARSMSAASSAVHVPIR